MFFRPPEVKAISKYSDFGSHLGSKSFGVMLAIAFALHAGLIGVYSMMPHSKIVKIPVRVLNINLGADLAESAPQSEQPIAEQAHVQLPDAPPKPDDETTSTKSPQLALEKALGGSTKTAVKTSHEKAAIDKKSTVKDIALPVTAPKRYVRESPLDLTKPKEGATKSTASQIPEEIVQRYTQDISLWVSQRKIYPEEAKVRHIEGVAIVRLRVNRQGKILYYVIEKSAGDAFLDHAAMTMVRNADPIPPVGDNYPGEADGPPLEFLIPITFKLEK